MSVTLCFLQLSIPLHLFFLGLSHCASSGHCTEMSLYYGPLCFTPCVCPSSVHANLWGQAASFFWLYGILFFGENVLFSIRSWVHKNLGCTLLLVFISYWIAFPQNASLLALGGLYFHYVRGEIYNRWIFSPQVSICNVYVRFTDCRIQSLVLSLI